MTEKHRAKPEVWAAVERLGKNDMDMLNCVLELRARVEELEADRWLRQHAKSVESNYPEFPDSSLIDSVIACIDNGTACDREPARIARETVLEIAAWVDRLGYHSCAAELRKEVPQPCCKPS
jgi:hypothetical protein